MEYSHIGIGYGMIDPSVLCEGPFHLRRDADAITQARWLAGWVLGYAEDQAIAKAADIDMTEPSGQAAVILACTARAMKAGIPRETAIAAGRSAWRTAVQNTERVEAAIRRAVVPLARERAPGERILSAAKRAADQTGIFVPSDVILDLARRIAHGTRGNVRR